MTPLHSLFTQTMSLTVHELRTPVTVIGGYLRMLLKEQGGPLTEKQRKMLEEAERSCGRVGALVNEMSELGKFEGGEIALPRERIDLPELLTRVAADMHEGENRGVQLDLRGAQSPLMVVGDRGRLEAALRALLHAALRERGEPGVIVAECSVTSNDPPSVLITIGDDDARRTLGSAAPEDAPFDEWRGGLGLALPLARRVIEAHGGALWSAPGDRARAGSAVKLPLEK